MTSNSKPSIFISHIIEEGLIAGTLKEFIEDKFLNSIDVFVSSHEDSLSLGKEWFDTIKNSLGSTQIMIVICSPISITRPWINFEAGAGWIRKIPVIPLCHSGLTPGKLPSPLNSLQAGNLNSADDIKKLFNIIAKNISFKAPNCDNEAFFNTVKDFETKAKNTRIAKDVLFVKRLLSRHVLLIIVNRLRS